MKDLTFPAWFNGPKGESEIFNTPEEVPTGWTSGAEKISVSGKKPAKVETVDQTGTAEIDADGHAFDPALHTGTKTKAGLWRMKVGVTRPAPVTAGAPLDL
jgi:hypothetical protein